jgi:hypothetical protein
MRHPARGTDACSHPCSGSPGLYVPVAPAGRFGHVMHRSASRSPRGLVADVLGPGAWEAGASAAATRGRSSRGCPVLPLLARSGVGCGPPCLSGVLVSPSSVADASSVGRPCIMCRAARLASFGVPGSPVPSRPLLPAGTGPPTASLFPRVPVRRPAAVAAGSPSSLQVPGGPSRALRSGRSPGLPCVSRLPPQGTFTCLRPYPLPSGAGPIRGSGPDFGSAGAMWLATEASGRRHPGLHRSKVYSAVSAGQRAQDSRDCSSGCRSGTTTDATEQRFRRSEHVSAYANRRSFGEEVAPDLRRCGPAARSDPGRPRVAVPSGRNPSPGPTPAARPDAPGPSRGAARMPGCPARSPAVGHHHHHHVGSPPIHPQRGSAGAPVP